MPLIITAWRALFFGFLWELCYNFDKTDCYKTIPEYWNEYMASERKPFKGQFGVCLDKGESIHYVIADTFYPWITPIPGWETVTFEAGLWAMHSADGPLPESLQKVNTFVWNEWMPVKKAE